MKRRDFFTLGLRKASQIALEVASEKVAQRAENWLRPPFAVDELDFLLACTRCDKCIESCSYGVIFKLPSSHGYQVAGTPAMDLLNRGCHLCQDWPCVMACEPDALKLVAGDEDEGEAVDEKTPPAIPLMPPKLALVRIDTQTCLPYLGPECGACAESCPVPGALEWEGGRRPVINQDVCTGCALCREACIVEPKAVHVAAFIPDAGDAPPDKKALSA